MLIRSGKSQKTAAEDRKNFYHSKQGQELLKKGDAETDKAQSVADDAMDKAAKEDRGLTTREINNVIDDVYFRQGARYTPAASKTSSSVKRFVARTNKKTGRAEWVPIN